MVISNGAGDLSSNVATVTVLDAPVIAVQPSDMNASTGATVAFTVTATGSEPLNYPWQKDINSTWTDINGSTAHKAQSLVPQVLVSEACQNVP